MAAGTVSKSRQAHYVTWISWAVLLGAQVLDAWVTSVPWIIWLGKVVPLLLFVPGMLKKNPRSYIWLCFVCLLYFLVLVERVFAQPDNYLAIVALAASVILFIAAMLYVRWNSQERKKSQEMVDVGEL